MFEGLVALLLNRVLGDYIENFDPKQLNIGIWSGDVRLSDLRLRKESLDKFKLPLDVSFGHLGNLTLLIPWSNLKQKPVKVVIEDVYLLALPIVAEYNAEEETRREQAAKQRSLRDLEVQTAIAPDESFTESLVTKIVDNLQVTIRNIHVRYEDHGVLAQLPYALGVTLEELLIHSADEEWKKSFISITQQLSRKLLLLRNFGVYMSTEALLLYSDDKTALLHDLKRMSAEQHILKPVSGEGRLTLNKRGATETHPHVHMELFFDEFGVDFDGGQYRDILWTASKLHWLQKTWRFRKLRPRCAVSEDPRAWFVFAAKSIYNEIHEKNHKWTWEHFRKRRDQRREYTALWRAKALKESVDERRLEQLEHELPFEDIKFYRLLTRRQLKSEDIPAQKEESSEKGWFSWWSKPKDDVMSPEQRQALYETIDYDEEQPEVSIPRERTKVQVFVTVKKAGVVLKPAKDAPSLAEVIVEGCRGQFLQRPDSLLATFQLHSLRVEDGTPKTLYKHVVSVKHGQKVTLEPFFECSFENNPLDSKADSQVVAKLHSMTIFYNPFFIEEVVRFFKPPKIHLDTVGAIMNAAEATMEGLTQQTRLGLQYALDEHKTVDLQLDLQAPLVIMPLDPTNWKSAVAIIDAGHLSVTSDLVDKSTIDEMRQKEQYSEHDWTRLNTLMYDQFNLTLQNAQFLVGPTIKSTMEQLHTASAQLAVIVSNLDIKLCLGVSILPDANNIPKITLGCEVPKINVAMNDFQYKTMMALIDRLMPVLDVLDLDDESAFEAYGLPEHAAIDAADVDRESAKSVERPEKPQHKFEMDLKIGKAVLSLSRCIDGVSLRAERFVDLIGDEFRMNLFKTDYGLHLDLSVTDIDLVDHIEKSGVPEFEKLVSSNNFVEEEGVQRRNELVKVDYLRNQRIVLFDDRRIEVFDQDINVDISALKFIVTRTSYLSILNFLLNTFVDPNPEETPADVLKHNSSNEEASPQRINVRVTLDSIIAVLNEDGIKLATMQLSTAEFTTLVLPEELEVRGKLGALTLHDETNHGSLRDSVFRKLVLIDGDNLAEFTYKLLDAAKNEQPYDSVFEFSTALIHVNFVEDAVGKIVSYLNKFQRMKEIYDRAREAAINQANKIDASAKVKVDLLIRAPTFYFPKVVDAERQVYDAIEANFGEFYLTNKFEHKNGIWHNVLSAGLRKVMLTSTFHFEVEQVEQMLEDLDIVMDIDLVDAYEPQTPTMTIKGNLPSVDMHLSELQLAHIYRLSNSLGEVFSNQDTSLDGVEEDAENANAVIKHDYQGRAPEQVAEKESHPDHVLIYAEFTLPKVSLTLYNRTEGLKSIRDNKITTFGINRLLFNLEMTEDGDFSSDFKVGLFKIRDVRKGTQNKFPEIIPSVDEEVNQLEMSAQRDQERSKAISVMLTLEKPLMILAVDYLVELHLFAQSSILNQPTSPTETAKSSGPSTMGFSINIKEPSIVLLADSTNTDSEAIVFRVEQVLVTSQNIISVGANNIGLFVAKISNVQEKSLRLVDDFSISFAYDSKGSLTATFLTNVHLSIDPLLVRISLRDIRLAMQIVNNANLLYSMAQGCEPAADEYRISDDFKRKLSQYAPSVISNLSNRSLQRLKEDIVVKGEEFNATIGGARLVLIGDIHELPVLDFKLNPFEAKVLNWSTELNAETHLEMSVNVYNYFKSTWEPILEPWQIAVFAQRVLVPKPSTLIDVLTREMAQISVLSRLVALLSQVFSSISNEPSERGEIAPYRIRNETGMDIEVWTDSSDSPATPLKPQETISWAFEDWRKIRENLDTDNANDVLGVRFSRLFSEVHKINASGVGESILVLYPPVDGVHSRLSCDITLGTDNVKTIHLRSTLVVQNALETAIKVQMTKANGDVRGELEIPAMTLQPLPIDAVYSDLLSIKPILETQFEWSEQIHWKLLMKKETSLTCARDSSSYCFQAEALYDPQEPLAQIYPHLTILITAPVEIENLLPFDFNFRLYDKSTKKDWSGSVKQGQSAYIHVVTLKSLLLLSVEPLNCGFEKSEFAIINVHRGSEFEREFYMSIKGQRTIRLKLHYPKRQLSKTSLKVSVYAPYVILNRTGQNLQVNEKTKYMLHSVTASGDKPCMFSFDRDGERLNRAVAKVGDSVWLAPMSFDAIGQSSGLSAQVSGKQLEMNAGLVISEGEGKFNLTKVVTFSPRYVVRNGLTEELDVMENGLASQLSLGPGKTMPLYNLRRLKQKSLLIRFSGEKWSSPFSIDDVGQIFLKVSRAAGQVLLKVNVITENATLFVQVEHANNEWPFSIRNFTDSEFFIYQSNPNVNLEGNVEKSDVVYKPIYYKVPPKSVMPYAFDYPNAIVKDVIIRGHGRERAVNLAEIGNLKPFRLPATAQHEQVIVDLNVVADGPTQSLVISNYNPSYSLYKLRENDSAQQFEVPEKDENYFMRVLTRFEGFGVSLVNTKNKELCYITLRGLEIRYNELDVYQNLSMKVKWIQIDNQLNGGVFPIILYPTVVPKLGKEMSSHPSLSGLICKVKDDTHGVLFIKYATVLLQEMTIEIDEDFLYALLDFSKFPGASWNKVSEDKLCVDLAMPEPEKLSQSSDVYFEALHLQPALTNLSFVRTERVNAEDRTLLQNAIMFFVNVLTMAIGNINDAPIKLNALFIENIRVPLPILVELVQTHYGQLFFYQLHKILGSADLLGNPVGLWSNLASGVLDIFYEPYHGFVINDRPQELGIGLAKGGLSFLKKLVFGFSDSFAKVTGSIAKGLTVATMDPNFQERRRLKQRRNRPRHALYGFATGANSAFDLISLGITGVARAPMEGAAKDGAGGFFKGLGKGMLGLPTKTAIGLFDLASSMGEGIRNTTTVFDADGLEKVRLPRFIAHDGVIRPYSQREAQGQFWLNVVDGGVHYTELYLAHLVLSGEEKAILVTFNKIMLFEINTLKSVWIISFRDVQRILIESTGVAIIKSGGGPFVPVPEKHSRDFLFNRLAVAVERYNDKCQVFL